MDNIFLLNVMGGGNVMLNEQQSLAAHEAMELHEAINFKTLCVAKSKLMQGLVFDQELKALMEKDVVQSIQAITELQAVYVKAPFQMPIREYRPTPILN
jgi:similar to spore coat protein